MNRAKDVKLNEILDIVHNNKSLVFFEELYTQLGVSYQTVYRRFPVGSPEREQIVEALNANKELVKNVLRKKWLASDNATLQLALYKLLARDEERKALNNTSSDINVTADKEIQLIVK